MPSLIAANSPCDTRLKTSADLHIVCDHGTRIGNFKMERNFHAGANYDISPGTARVSGLICRGKDRVMRFAPVLSSDPLAKGNRFGAEHTAQDRLRKCSANETTPRTLDLSRFALAERRGKMPAIFLSNMRIIT
jgi:hypothetical protein